MPHAKFPLGQLVATPGALRALQESGQSPLDFVARHVSGDWGAVDAEDCQLNDRAVVEGSRILSAYVLKDGTTKVWVITEADRSSTVVLLPSEY